MQDSEPQGVWEEENRDGRSGDDDEPRRLLSDAADEEEAVKKRPTKRAVSPAASMHLGADDRMEKSGRTKEDQPEEET